MHVHSAVPKLHSCNVQKVVCTAIIIQDQFHTSRPLCLSAILRNHNTAGGGGGLGNDCTAAALPAYIMLHLNQGSCLQGVALHCQ